MDLKKNNNRKYRPEIEGLRAVAAMLVAIYHIWFGNVSGGVDVFFVVSGFLITTSLLSRLEKNGKINFFEFISNLTKRLFPAAFFVLFMVIIASLLWLPKVRWDQTVSELFASIFYFQNWHLANNAVDYLAQNNEASPFQHIWAMSIQGQFYIIWPLLLFLAIFLSNNILKKSIKSSLLLTFIAVFIFSLSYSIYKTSVLQPWAYFDTFARVWEFSIGGILALTINYFTLKKSWSVILGWLGLIAIISCGMVLQVSTVFPGYAALWPTLGAAFILIAGSQGGSYGVHRLLSYKPFVKFGSISYAFYLWHWPILIFYYVITGKDSVSVNMGLILILASIILSIITTNFIEKPLRKTSTTKMLITKNWNTAIICMLPVILFASIWFYIVESQNSQLVMSIENDEYPGAIALTSEISYPNDVPIRPSPLQARQDLPKVYEDGCHQTQTDPEVLACEYGITSNPDNTIALVGGSHSAHWLPALEAIAESHNIKIVSYTKSSCRFTSEGNDESCTEWNMDLIEKLIDSRPDLVFTTADVGQNLRETVPSGFIDKWEILEMNDIPIFAVRDNPWFEFDVPTCVEENKNNINKCKVERDKILLSESAWNQLDNPPSNVYYSDLSDSWCDEDYCGPVVGNVLVYRDRHHFTATFSKTLAPVLAKELLPLLN